MYEFVINIVQGMKEMCRGRCLSSAKHLHFSCGFQTVCYAPVQWKIIYNNNLVKNTKPFTYYRGVMVFV
jgi:hypothetical protein